MLGAFLVDRVPLTTARVRQRIQAGAPIYGTSADRPTGIQRRVPFGARGISPEAYNAAFSAPQFRNVNPILLGRAMLAQSSQSGDATGKVYDTGAIYRQAQQLLVAWRKGGGPIDPPDFGDADITGTDSPRTVTALRSFQKYVNLWQPEAGLREDGTLDDATLGHLVIATAGAAPEQKSTIKSKWPLWAVIGGTLLAIGYSEYGGKRSK